MQSFGRFKALAVSALAYLVDGRISKCRAMRHFRGRVRVLEATICRRSQRKSWRCRHRSPHVDPIWPGDDFSRPGPTKLSSVAGSVPRQTRRPSDRGRGRSLKQSHAALFASIEQRYGVPPGPLLAIWGMETGFGAVHGNQNMLSAVATLAYDCRRSAYFTDQLYAALKLVDAGVFSAATRGSMHGEVGQTQFLPKTVLEYGTGGSLETPAGALSSTANFLHAHGWRAGAGYQPGEANFAAIQAWNAASVYQHAIAIIGRQIDGR